MTKNSGHTTYIRDVEGFLWDPDEIGGLPEDEPYAPYWNLASAPVDCGGIQTSVPETEEEPHVKAIEDHVSSPDPQTPPEEGEIRDDPELAKISIHEVIAFLERGY